VPKVLSVVISKIMLDVRNMCKSGDRTTYMGGNHLIVNVRKARVRDRVNPAVRRIDSGLLKGQF